MSRFDRYRPESDFAPWLKLEPGESFRGTLTGVREIGSERDGDVSPVLDLVDFRGGEHSWIAGTWSAREQLAFSDPQDNDVIEIRRGPDRGRSHQYAIHVVEKASAEPEIPVDGGDLPFGTGAA